MLNIEDAESGPALGEARALFQEYAAALDHNLDFQNFAEELATLPGSYARPRGRLLLALWHDAVAGCVALRPLESDIAELKRLYVRPSFRSHGIGRRLAEHTIHEARVAGYQRIRLDTLPSMSAAITLYRQLGFQEIEPYRHNPVEGAVFLELSLTGAPVVS